MDDRKYEVLREDIKALHAKLDKYVESTTRNSADIAWLQRGMFGSFFTYIGAAIWVKFGGG